MRFNRVFVIVLDSLGIGLQGNDGLFPLGAAAHGATLALYLALDAHGGFGQI